MTQKKYCTFEVYGKIVNGEALYVKKPKLRSDIDLIIIKVNTGLSQKEAKISSEPSSQ